MAFSISISRPTPLDSGNSRLPLRPPIPRNRCGLCTVSSMNGCHGDPCSPVGLRETRTLPSATTPALAMSQLSSAVSDLGSDPPQFSSGIIRLEVPIQQQIDAISWLHAQCQLPRCFFSNRKQTVNSKYFINGSIEKISNGAKPNLVSVAGVGSAVFFQQFCPFSENDWRCIKRFLPEDCPLIRAYGAIRFDGRTDIAPEWEGFGSFYFVIPQVELDELEGNTLLAVTIAWDDTLLWTWRKAMELLEDTMCQISSTFVNLEKEVLKTTIMSINHTPSKLYWDSSVRKALQIISRKSSGLIKVVLARSSRVVTSIDVDPSVLLACLQVEGQNSYQFCIHPPNSPAFIGNTPEQLFHRKFLNISSEALAGTRARGRTKSEDLQIENELLLSPKDHLEFSIVRESIRRKLEVICSKVYINQEKGIRKLPRVQHLYSQLLGRLTREDNEFEILSSLHPSPAVCGLPTEEARLFIAENEMFDRGMYAGPVGWFGGRESEFAVGIRSALIQKGLGIITYAGAGIVEGTHPSSEWEELELKASQFIKLIQTKKPYESIMSV